MGANAMSGLYHEVSYITKIHITPLSRKILITYSKIDNGLSHLGVSQCFLIKIIIWIL